MAKKRGNNEGSISRRSNRTWRAQISVSGKRLSYSADTRTECQSWLYQKMVENHESSQYPQCEMLLHKFLLQWINSRKIDLRPKTVYQYEKLIKRYIIPRIGNFKLKEIDFNTMEGFYNELLKSEVSIRQIRYIHAVLHSAFKKAIRSGLLSRNPADGVAIPRLQSKEMKVLDESQVSLFLIAAQYSRHYALYHLAIATGMREGEILGLRWDDLEWHSGTLHVCRQIQSIPGKGNVICEPKTKSGIRSIKFGEGLLHALREHKHRQELEIQEAGNRWLYNNLIFPSTRGTPLNISNLRKDFQRTLKKAGLEIIRFHDLRHTAASLMLNHNIPAIVVSKRLGHSKTSTTLDIYGHLLTGMQGEAASLMDQIITPIQIEIPKKEETIPVYSQNPLHHVAPQSDKSP